jgi:hypothetical protein
MTIPYPQAKKLCTATEFQLLETVRTEKLQSLKAAALKAKIARTRGFLDKWRDLGIQQARKAKMAAAPERTAQKVAWFTEALRRLEAQLGKLEKAAEAAAKQKALKAKKAARPKAVVPAGPKRGGKGNPMKAPKAVETRAKVRQMRIAQSGQMGRRHGHVLAAGKRNQAKRNAR